MNQVNFLPDSYRAGRARKRRVARQGFLVALVTGGLLVWGGVIQNQLAEKTARADGLDDQVIAARNMKTEMNRLKEQQKMLRHLVKVQEELSQPVAHTNVIATIANMIPEQIALTELSIVTQRPDPARAIPTGATKSKKRKKAEARTVQQSLLEIELQALSPDAASVANLVEAFYEHPMFTDVNIRHTRAVEVRNLVAREFRLELTVDLERTFIDPDDAQEVASAH